MFGTYRTYLALIVVVHHLLSIPVVGHYAVHGFFILSGYLMTFILCRSYGFNLRGFSSFAINRFLRLFPTYWVIILFSIIVILLFGEDNSILYRNFIYIPDTFIGWAQNLSLIYFDIFPSKVMPRLSPPTWALTIELVFYFLIAIGLSKNKKITSIWFALSVLYMLSTHILPLGYSYRYSIIFAGTLPFSVGAMIYHFYDDLKKILSMVHSKVYTLFLALTLNFIAGALLDFLNAPKVLLTISFYLNYLINSLLVFSLIENDIPVISKKADKFIGDFSYPRIQLRSAPLAKLSCAA